MPKLPTADDEMEHRMKPAAQKSIATARCQANNALIVVSANPFIEFPTGTKFLK